jgi:cation diffusion facilitator CzcD-associated flavoprotein CzcO
MFDQNNSFDAIIIGAGFSGLYQLHALRDQLKLNTLTIESGADLGGTWFWNRYPGARCDSESHSYCYMFSEEIYKEWEWSERYPGPKEIRSYLNFVADKLNLKKDIKFNTLVTKARFIESDNKWELTTEGGETYRATYLITGIGCISSANIPSIPGLQDFQGKWYHTGNWPHEEVSFENKRVGQIGTGSTGIQAAPEIAKTAGHLHVFQRTPNYSVPARNAPLSDVFKKQFHDDYEEIKEAVRSTPNGHPFRISETKVFEHNESERKKVYEDAWSKGGLQFRATYQDLTTNKEANDTAADFLREKIKTIVHDKKTADSLSDINYPYAGKRPPIDTNYFETFNRDNVSLVDLKKESIVKITEDGIETSARHIPLDIIVFATGFDAITGKFMEMDIQGRNELKLSEAWKEGPKTYLGLQTPGFPNLFSITGPGSPSVLCNMPVPIEQHVEWITNCIEHMRKNNIDTCEASEEAANEWVAHVNEAANATLLVTVPHSWYLGANVEGKPRVFMPYAGGMVRYRALCDDVVKHNYAGFVMTSKNESEHNGKNDIKHNFDITKKITTPGI